MPGDHDRITLDGPTWPDVASDVAESGIVSDSLTTGRIQGSHADGSRRLNDKATVFSINA